MLKVQEIVDEINNDGELMECFISVTAIDDETILFTGMDIEPGIVKRIIQDNGYKITDRTDYTIVNGETFNQYHSRLVHEWIDRNMPDELSHWSPEGREEEKRLKKRFFKENSIQKGICVIKIEPYDVDIESMYEEWKNREIRGLTVKKLIQKLEKLNPNAIVCGMDNEYGEYVVDRIETTTQRKCPDCKECGCVHCKTRKMFEQEYIILE